MKSNDIKDKRIWIADTQYKVTEQKYQGQTIWSGVHLAQDSDFVKVNNFWVYRGTALKVEIPTHIQGQLVTTTSYMFSGMSTYGASPVTKVVLKHSNSIYAANMFSSSQATTLDLSDFDASNVTNTTSMFQNSLATIGYARTQSDANKFNASSNRPAGLYFVLKSLDTLIAGDMEAGFYGEVLSSDFINGEELASTIGLTAGNAVNTTEPWLKFSWQGKVQYMPKKHIRHNLTWNQLLNVNAIYGDNVITIKGVKYKVRLMSSAPLGALGDFTSATSQVHYSEWNKLMHPIHERARTGSWYTKSNVESDIENWNINYTNADLGFGTMYNFTSTSIGTSTTGGNFVNRGYYDPSFSASWAKSSLNGSFGWRPVLEVVSQSGGETPTGIRYIRDIINGNTINTANHWIEIMAFENDVNVARDKLVLVDGESGVSKAETITDGNTANTQNSYRSGGNIVVIDLGDLYKVDRVQVWHYYGDNRQYYKAKTEVSADGINWITLYDSDVDGTYTETAEGKTHYITADTVLNLEE